MTTVDVLNAHQETLRRKKEAKANLQGQRAQIEKNLKDKFGVSSVEGAGTLHAEKTSEIAALDGQVTTLLTEIEDVIGQA